MISSPKPTASVSNVKGHLVTKSSALAATGSCKLESQFLVAQNLASHYKRVISAKSSVDHSAPKSMLTSQKARDRAKREMLNFTAAQKKLERAKSADANSRSIDDQTSSSKFMQTMPRTATSARPNTSSYTPPTSRIEDMKPRVLPDQKQLHKQMVDMMAQFTKPSTSRVQTYRPTSATPKVDSQQQQSFNPMLTRKLTNETNDDSNTIMFNSKNRSQNVLAQSTFAHPALKAMSKLVSGHNYDILDNHQDKFKIPDTQFQPRIKNTTKESSLQKSSHYQPPRRRKKKPQKSFDDNNNNNGGQTSARESIVSTTERLKNNDDYEIDEEISNDDDDDEDENRVKAKYQTHLNTSNHSNYHNGLNESNNFLNTSQHQNQKQMEARRVAAQKEEDLKYLQFVKEVTDDIISRGITSNRVINNCFNYHVKKNKHLNETKMRELLNTLRKDIGVPDENEIHVDSAYHHTINKAITLDNERNKENIHNESNRSYLTLQKFSDTNMNVNETQSNLSFNASRQTTSRPNDQTSSLMNKNVFSIHDDTAADDDINLQQSSKLSAHSSRNASRTSLTQQQNSNQKSKNLFDAYENQIIKNIQSIRRNSNSSGGSSGGGGGVAQKMGDDGTTRRRGSSSGKSEGAVSSRRNSNGSVSNTNVKKAIMTSPTPQVNKNDDDDDDDDIFSGSSQLVKPTAVAARAASLTNLKSSNSHLEKQTNLDYTDEISFNDDYGETEENNNNSMLKTKNSRRQETPQPVPRSGRAQETKYNRNRVDEDDSDQNFDLDEDYGGGEEDEEDDDKF